MVFSKVQVVSVILVILCIVPRNELTEHKEGERLIKDEESKMKFEKLLTSIANVNKERVDALERYNALENYNVARGVLRTIEGDNRDPMRAILSLIDYDLERNNDGLLDGVNANVNNYVRKATAVDPKIHEILTHFDESKDILKNELRKQIRKLYQRGILNMTNISEEDYLDSQIDEDYNDYVDMLNNGAEVDMDDEANSGYGGEEDDEEAKDVKDGEGNDLVDAELNDVNDDVGLDINPEIRYYDDAIRHRGKQNCGEGRCRCIKACKCSYEHFCAKFACSLKERKRFCKNCRLQCRVEFFN